MATTDPAPQTPSLSMSREASAQPSPASRDLDRVLVVHAHPDDETIVTGATLATLVDEGAAVTVVTCTRGELGEVMPADLAHLRGDDAGLAVHREGELGRAMKELGISDHRFLGDVGARTAGFERRAYRDSGMEWGDDGRPVPVADLHPAAFCAADFSEIVSDLASVIAEVRPSAVVSYDVDGGYGHPDHVRVNRAATSAARLSGVPYFAITGGTSHPDPARTDDVVTADIVINGQGVLDRKVRALGEYRTQVAVVATPGGPALEYPHGAVEPVTTIETFRHVPEPAQAAAPVAPAFDDLGISGKAVVYLIALVAGGLFGAIGTVAHQDLAGSFPIGAVLSLLLVAALFVGFRLAFDARLVGVVAAIGLLAVVAALSLPGSGGSALIPANLPGYAWSFGPTLIAVVVLAWPRLPKKGESPRSLLPARRPSAK